MSDLNSYQPRRFQSTVDAYARFRLGYPDRLIRRVIELVGLKSGDPVLDLGCGPGLLTLPFALAGMAVTAVDPEPEMLEVLKNAADTAHLPVQTYAGSSFDLPSGIGSFRLITMGRAFHWMDRIETAKTLDRLVAANGALALFDDETLKTAENRWRQVLDAVATHYGADEAPHRAARSRPDYRSHESILLDSPFAALETLGEIVTRTLSADDIVGLAGSLSVTSQHALGERAAAFEVELRQDLMSLSSDGRFREIAEMRVLIARRAF